MTRFWQYKVYADIRGGSQDLRKFSLDLRLPVSVYIRKVWHTIVVVKFTSNRAAASTSSRV